jgi:glycerate 2-kinase
VKVIVAPDGFGGTLSAREAADAMAEGWRRARPDDELVAIPLSDGGEGLLDAIATASDTWLTTEVAGPHGHPVDAALLLREDGSAVVESAQACGLALVPPERRTPLVATTYGVGQLLDAAREAGARRIVVGLGGSATVDGGAGALTGLGFRLRVEDGSGLKIGGGELHRVRRVEHGWIGDWGGIEVVLLADVTTRLLDAARIFGPQKGASRDEVGQLTEALEIWADVAERDLAGPGRYREVDGSGAAGGLGFGLACALGARFAPGAATVAELQGLPAALRGAHLLVSGEGRLDATSFQGKVVGHVVDLAHAAGVRATAVVGSVDPAASGADVADGADDAELPDLELIEEAAPEGPGEDPAVEVAEAARRLASRC